MFSVEHPGVSWLLTADAIVLCDFLSKRISVQDFNHGLTVRRLEHKLLQESSLRKWNVECPVRTTWRLFETLSY